MSILNLALFVNCLQHGRTAVHYGAMEGHTEVVELLIDKYNLSATAKDDVSSKLCYLWCIGLVMLLFVVLK